MVIFIDAASRVDKEGLRVYVLTEMQRYKEIAEKVCVTNRTYWERLNAVAATTLYDEDRQKALKVIDQLLYLPQFIGTWISTALDSSERFEFFVMAKAHELNSGDQQRDYYWGMQIRHDQLVALVRVIEMLLDKMKLWLSLRPNEVLSDPVFSGLTEYDVEQQIFLEAERIYKERQKIAGGKHETDVSSS